MIFSPEVNDLLGARGAFGSQSSSLPWKRLLLVLFVCGAIHGIVMGASSGSLAQMCLSAVKVPFLITISTCLCIPSLYAVTTISGLRDDFPAILRAILAAQATVAVTLCALSPMLLLLYASTSNYSATKLINGVLFLIASAAGQVTLMRHYEHLIRRNPLHIHGRRLWWALYILVTIQLAWVLRPFIGSPGMAFQLIREEAWGNAYVEILRMLFR